MPPWTGKAGSFPINVESIISAFPAPVKPFFPMRKNAPTVPKNSRSMDKLCVFAVEIADALLLHQREAEKRLCVQILCAQPDRRDAPVFALQQLEYSVISYFPFSSSQQPRVCSTEVRM